MSKICTSIEQSKKLIELGIDVNTADMYWSMEEIPFLPFPVNDVVTNWSYAQENGMLPAWSLTALLELIQWDYKLEKTLFDQSDLFTYSIVCNDLDYRTYEHDNEPLDAAFEMVCWLKENEKI